MERYGEKRREGLGRKEGSGDETTLIEVYAQVAVQKTRFLLHMQSGSLHKPLWRTQSSFLFCFLDGGTKPLHHEEDIDHLIVVLRFSEPPQFLNTLYRVNLSFHQKLQCTESVGLRQVLAPPWAAPLVNWTPRFLRLHLASFRVRFSIRTPPSIPHFIISSSFFSESCSIPKHCKGASTSLQWFGKFFPSV